MLSGQNTQAELGHRKAFQLEGMRLLDVTELGQLLDLSPKSIRSMISGEREGSLPPVTRVGKNGIRFRLDKVMLWLDDRTEFPSAKVEHWSPTQQRPEATKKRRGRPRKFDEAFSV